MRRRTLLGAIPAITVGLAGCSDGLTRFEAEPARVTEAAREDTGYEESRVEQQEIERNFEGTDESVVVVNVLAEYSREVDLVVASGELARFTAFSTPKVELAGQTFNPVGEMDDEELAETLQEEYDTLDNVERVGGRDAEFLGESIEVSRFEADAETAGESVDVFVHIAQGESADDFVVGLAVHPRDIDETEAIDRLLAGVEHPA